MLSNADRILVERIRRAKSIKIVINEDSDDQTTLAARPRIKDIRKLAHEVAIAWQDYLNVPTEVKDGTRKSF